MQKQVQGKNKHCNAKIIVFWWFQNTEFTHKPPPKPPKLFPAKAKKPKSRLEESKKKWPLSLSLKNSMFYTWRPAEPG